MGVLNTRGFVVLTILTGIFSFILSYWIAQRELSATTKTSLSPVVQEALLTHPPPHEMTPPGVAVTPGNPGVPISTISIPTPVPTWMASVP